MERMIFVNLPVADLACSRRFYEAIGAVNDPRFTDDTAACMTFSERIHVMLLTHDKYRQFTDRPIADSHRHSAMLLCLSEASREAVDAVTERALAAGGREHRAPQDMGFLYSRAFEDPDGNVWEPLWMDMAAFDKMQAA